MYCLRLFIARTTLYTTTFTVIIVVCSLSVPSFILIGYCVSELHGHKLYVPIVMYGLRLFIVVLQSYRLLSHHQVLLLYTLWFLR